MLLIVGAANVGLAYGAQHALDADPSVVILVVALGLYIFRVVVQDKKRLQLRLPAATMPEEERRWRSHHVGLRLGTRPGAGGEPAPRSSRTAGRKPPPAVELVAMGRIDLRWLRAARLAGATLVAVGAFDVVLRGRSLSRDEDGAILLAAGAALLALHVVLARRGGRDSTDALLAAALAVPFIPAGVALFAVLAALRRLALRVRRRHPLAVSGRGVRGPLRGGAGVRRRLCADAASALGARGGARGRIRSRASERGARPDLLRHLDRLVDSGAHPRRRGGGRASPSRGGCPWRPSGETWWSPPRSCSPLRPRPGRSAGAPTPAVTCSSSGSWLPRSRSPGGGRRPGSPSPSSSPAGSSTVSLANRSGYVGVAPLLVGVALAGGATCLTARSASRGGPPALPPAPAA